MGMPRFDIGEDALDPGWGNTGVRYDHQIERFARPVVKRAGESSEGLHNCYIEAMLPEYLRKTGSDNLLLRDDQDVVNSYTSIKMKAGSRMDTGFIHRWTSCQLLITSFVRRVETPSALVALLARTTLIPAGYLDSLPSRGPCIR